MDKHIIIIGSGLGGLVCGYILAKNGYRITILEKNAQSGGCLQNFTRNGIKFDTGMHYIGSIEEGQTLHQFFKYLSLFSDVKLRSLDKMAYDTISIDGMQYPCANGRKNFVDQLSQYFPQERANLQHYYNIIADITKNLPLHSLNVTEMPVEFERNYFQTSASEFIESITDNHLLRNVLVGNLALYRGVYGKTPLYIHALIRDFYNKSAYRIIGGSDAIAKSLVKSIRAMGGEVRMLTPVDKINCNDTQAVSVTLQNKEEIHGDYFITNIHPVRMLEMLKKTPLIRKVYRERIINMQNTISNFTVYIKFKKDTVPYLNTNKFYHNNDNVWNCENYTYANWHKSFLYMHACSSADSLFADAAVVIAYMRFEEVERWKNTSRGSRGNDYEEFKQCKAERLLNELEKQNHGILKNIDAYYTSSPLTYLDYTGTERGSMYGILHDCNNLSFSTVSHRTKIPNLYQTGQNINLHGILGVMIGTLITTGEFLGIDNVVKQIVKA
ncbi:MAG: NAD(P)-binding protein [Bacteroidales bacterium]|jgi:all-trans-retinol 13,14-reductase|nr:NAD(P)-binding protein [Bacteroidales bacterium]